MGKTYTPGPTVVFAARFPGRCVSCQRDVNVSDRVTFAPRPNGTRGVRHEACPAPAGVYATGAAPGANVKSPDPTPVETNAAPTTRIEAELAAIAAIEDLIVFAAREDIETAKRLDAQWSRYQKVKALALGSGATVGESEVARRKALNAALNIAKALVEPHSNQGGIAA